MLGNDSIEMAKASLRERIRNELRKMTSEERASASRQACARLGEQAIWRGAKSILFYAPAQNEVDIWRLFADARSAGKTVLLPRYNPETNAYLACHLIDRVTDLRKGRFGILEPNEHCSPISSNRLDLILVPGVAFDFDGHRLGRGKGYYDQLLSALHGPTCGVAFDEQIVGHVPTESHDIRLSCILTPTRWHCVKEPRAVLK